MRVLLLLSISEDNSIARPMLKEFENLHHYRYIRKKGRNCRGDSLTRIRYLYTKSYSQRVSFPVKKKACDQAPNKDVTCQKYILTENSFGRLINVSGRGLIRVRPDDVKGIIQVIGENFNDQIAIKLYGLPVTTSAAEIEEALKESFPTTKATQLKNRERKLFLCGSVYSQRANPM
ncbi:hypothetical protein CEXT_346111 [Caerostris extrusa]|uniref:Uncharacterized protein n=1 Tax=Caerostris extrusa TaxID=172846 RepID=A0AAV4T2X7_CAEEX|nr:hypothetical protein CEXT_346111 [Caerostris extrusa]